MAMFGDKRADKVIEAGAKALQGGAYFFTPKLEWPTGTPSNSTHAEEWARIIHELEANGWALTQWQVVKDRDEFVAFPLFRRR